LLFRYEGDASLGMGPAIQTRDYKLINFLLENGANSRYKGEDRYEDDNFWHLGFDLNLGYLTNQKYKDCIKMGKFLIDKYPGYIERDAFKVGYENPGKPYLEKYILFHNVKAPGYPQNSL